MKSTVTRRRAREWRTYMRHPRSSCAHRKYRKVARIPCAWHFCRIFYQKTRNFNILSLGGMEMYFKCTVRHLIFLTLRLFFVAMPLFGCERLLEKVLTTYCVGILISGYLKCPRAGQKYVKYWFSRFSWDFNRGTPLWDTLTGRPKML